MMKMDNLKVSHTCLGVLQSFFNHYQESINNWSFNDTNSFQYIIQLVQVFHMKDFYTIHQGSWP